jgi:pyrroline-5-carboxylate reductase
LEVLGNLGSAIIQNLIPDTAKPTKLPFKYFLACVRSESSQKALEARFADAAASLSVHRGDNVKAVTEADVVILGADPADIERVLQEPGLREALGEKLLISVAAGWTRQKLESTLYGEPTTAENHKGRAAILRTLPNIAALVSESLTAIEISEPALPEEHIKLADSIFRAIGKTVHIPPRLMDATTAVAGSTPAFFAIICDALIDASVAVGVPRDMARTMILQSMQGSAALLQSGMHTGVLRDQGTSPEGCTIGGVMVLEEGAVRGHLGRALREAVTVARQMGKVEHPNDTNK